MTVEKKTTVSLVMGAGVLLIGGAIAVLFGFSILRTFFLWTGRTPVARGRLVAERMGCFGCHGEGGVHGIKNPKSKDGEVPSWDGGTLMMFAKNRDEVQEWILDGAPKRMWDDPAYVARRKEALIEMPAYRGGISQRDLDDLVAFFMAQSLAADPPDAASQKGQQLCLQYGCFACHGSEGRGFVQNPKSFKGYIPAWIGSDYAELVRNDAELSEWILDGICKRMENQPIAKHILEGQVVRMPRYRGVLTDDDVKAISAYVTFLRSGKS